MNNLNKVKLLFTLAVIFWIDCKQTNAMNIIRDTEIEMILRNYSDPIFIAADIPPDTITIRIISDDSLNAFVTTGNRMFINTGTLLTADSASEIIGVVSHETGHIAAAHTVTFSTGMQQALRTTILSTLLGVAAGVATGNSDVAMAFALGGQGTAQKQMLSYSRGQESAADQFALKALEDTKQSALGLDRFFERISNQELLPAARQDPYVRTHPLTRSRRATIQAHIATSKYANVPTNHILEKQHQIMRAKLFSFLKPYSSTLKKYPIEDVSDEAHYARAIAHYRRGKLDLSVPIIDSLITNNPKNPFYWELKGQMLFENGLINKSVLAYRNATQILPNSSLIQTAFAHAMLETDTDACMSEAENALRVALHLEPNNVFAWDLSARCYAMNNKTGMSAYAAAEKALLLREYTEAIRHATKAEEYLIKNSPLWLRLQDLKLLTQQKLRKQKSSRR